MKSDWEREVAWVRWQRSAPLPGDFSRRWMRRYRRWFLFSLACNIVLAFVVLALLNAK